MLHEHTVRKQSDVLHGAVAHLERFIAERSASKRSSSLDEGLQLALIQLMKYTSELERSLL